MHINIVMNVNVLLNVTSLGVGCLTFTKQSDLLCVQWQNVTKYIY